MEHFEAIRKIKQHLLERISDEASLLALKNHIAECHACIDSLGERVIALIGTPQSFATGKIDFLTCEECDETLPEYAELREEEAKERYPATWRHLQFCASCSEVNRHLHEIAIEEENEASGPIPTGPTFAATYDKKRIEELMSSFDGAVDRASTPTKSTLQEMRSKLETLFQKTFADPTPSFAPVFGENKATVLSPFGKVRYPIIFEWEPHDDADQYILSLEEAEWSVHTQETKISLTSEELSLTFGDEYMWELKNLKEGEVIDEITGFFSLLSHEDLQEIEEIEGQIKDIELREEARLLLGGILEEKCLFIEAIDRYKDVYALQPSPGIAYRIAYCYDKLELEDLRDEWNRKI